MRNQIRLYLPFLLMLVLAAAVCARWSIPAHMFMREPQTLGRLPWYAGLFSLAGGWLWASAATACLMGWSILRRRPGSDRLPVFLLYFGLLTIAVLLDDALQLHEHADAIGIPEKATGAIYLAVLLGGLISFRDEILRSDFRLFASAILFLGLSVIIDALQSIYGEGLGPWRILLEDGFKILGAAGWCGFFWTTASRSLHLPVPAALSRGGKLIPAAGAGR